jgi:hypothetical protein
MMLSEPKLATAWLALEIHLFSISSVMAVKIEKIILDIDKACPKIIAIEGVYF